jgi:lipopolysaccharide transport system ATP-binding protein
VSAIITCADVSKAYRTRASLGLKEMLVGRHRKNLGGRFSRTWALRDVSFSVPHGSAFAVIGANGSGKSTLLSLILGTLRPDSGMMRVDGSMAALLELGAGFHPELTGRENVFLYGSILGMRIREIRERFEQIVEFSELGDAIDNPLRTYSSGMVTRLGFATITHVNADVLLVDEVLAVGDLDFQAKCRRYFDEFKTRGTLVIVSHDLDSVAELCDHGLWLDQGVVAYSGPIQQVVDRYRHSVTHQSHPVP